MDYTMIDVTDIQEVDVGTQATLIGNEDGDPLCSEVADWALTIPWEILSRISQRVPRLYKSKTF